MEVAKARCRKQRLFQQILPNSLPRGGIYETSQPKEPRSH